MTELCVKELTIDKLELLVSVHASVKMFVASDQAPITLAAFSRQNVVSTREQILADLAFHYGTGALYSAGMCSPSWYAFKLTSKRILRRNARLNQGIIDPTGTKNFAKDPCLKNSCRS